jgi:O-antigen/teichoic acid export membrane protein
VLKRLRSGSNTRHRVPAGILDSAFSSTATFLVSLLAVHELGPTDLGVYALAFTAFLFIATLPAALIFIPSEVAAIAGAEGVGRLGVLRRSIPVGARAAILASVLGTAAMLAIPIDASWTARTGMAGGLLLLGMTSPIQDHLRRLLHAATHSAAAAAVSLVQLGAVILGASAFLLAGLGHRAWVPFTVLGLANLTSLLVAIAYSRRALQGVTARIGFDLRRVLGTGRWLLSSQLAGAALGFILVAIVGSFSGSAAIGFGEAARTLTQPPTVLVVGLLSVVGPEIQSAASRRKHHRVRSLQLAFGVPVIAMSCLWGLLIIPAGPSTVVRHFFPGAYQVKDLLVVTLIAQVLTYSNNIFSGPFLALGKARRLATTGYLTMAVALVMAILLREHGALGLAYAGGTAEVVQISVLLWRQRRLLNENMRSRPAENEPAELVLAGR